MESLKILNLAVRFLLEISTLVALGYWGVYTGKGLLYKTLLGLGAPTMAAVIWGVFAAPKAPIQLPIIAQLLVEILVFGAGALALYMTGHSRLSLMFCILVLLNRTLMLVWKQ